MRAGFARAALTVMILLSPLSVAAPRAEVAELHMATQYGIGTLAMVLVEQKQLLEKHLAQAGLESTKVTWRQFPAGNPMNEGLLSGRLDIVSGGTTVFITLWGKTNGTSSAVRGIGAVSALLAHARSQGEEDRGPWPQRQDCSNDTKGFRARDLAADGSGEDLGAR